MRKKIPKTTEFVIRYTDKKLDEYLIQKGFFAIKKGMYENLNSTYRIEISEGIEFIRCNKGSFYEGSEVLAKLSFLPEIPIIDYILREINFIL